MITTQFLGGLGNNIFQLANIYSLHKKHNVEYVIPKYVHRGDIGKYGQSTTLEFDRIFENDFNYGDVNLSSFQLYQHHDMNPSKTNFKFSEIPFKDNVCYNGYFQSDKYFSNVNIKQEFVINSGFKDYLYSKYADFFNKETIALHCRLGGDRVTSQMQHYHTNVTPDFYEESIKSIVGDKPENYNILVFSDRINDAMVLLSGLSYNLNYIINKDNVEDFIMMTMTNHVIISNSTFSWWSAYFNDKNGIIIAPKTQWFGKGYSHFDLSDIFPNNWITK